MPDRQIDSVASKKSELFIIPVPVNSPGANRTCALFALGRGVVRGVDEDVDGRLKQGELSDSNERLSTFYIDQ